MDGQADGWADTWADRENFFLRGWETVYLRKSKATCDFPEGGGGGGGQIPVSPSGPTHETG